MDFNLSKKRARSHSIEAEEPPNKKLCASGPGPNRSGMILPSHPEPSISEDRLPLTSNVLEEEAEFEAEMNVIAEKNGVTEQDFSAESGFDDDFEAELETAFNDGGNEPVSHEKSLPPNASEDDARHDEAPDNDASDNDAPDNDAPDNDAPDNDAPDNDAPDNDASADHALEDKASECDKPLPETSGKKAAMAHLESNTAEKSSTPPGSPASSNSKKLSTVSAGSSSRVLVSSPETPMTSIFDETSPSPPDSTKSTPQRSKADDASPSTAPKPLAKPRPVYVGPSFRERRPLTTEHRVMVRNAIDYTLRDLYKRTNIELGTMDTEKGTQELYDTSLESFAYQYARAQHRFKQYHESKDLKAGINTTTKKYRKRTDRRFEEFDLLCEVEGPWRTGFDDWKTPGASQAGGIIDFSSD